MTTNDTAGATRRRRLPRKMVAVLAALAMVVVLASCRFVGGGTLPSSTGHGNATVSGSFNCPNSSNGPGTGALNYIDQRAGVSLTGTVTGCRGSSTIKGTYTPRGGGASGTFTVFVIPGRTGTSEPAYFSIVLSGGRYGGYSDSGQVTGQFYSLYN